MSFPRYKKYKPSGVEWLGDVPEHWEVKRIRFVAELNPSKSEVAALDRETSLPQAVIGQAVGLPKHQRCVPFQPRAAPWDPTAK
ncbi:MAG: Type restriction-modification system, specificity subunit [Verrucomicrobiota bacterium]|jgi:type I restriction enzyme S subunit